MVIIVGWQNAHALMIAKIVDDIVMPRNRASLALARKCGFREEGLSQKYLRINGVWEDHIHMVRLNEKGE